LYIAECNKITILSKSDRNRERSEEVEGKLISTRFFSSLKAQKIYLFAVYYSAPACPSGTGRPECSKSAGKGI
jgi:hypothetical protein